MTRKYSIKTYDDLEYLIDEKNALALIEAWTNSDKSFPVNLNGTAISSQSIKSITPGALTEADLDRVPTKRQLASGKICQGQYSIQREINNIAKDEGGTKWAKLIRDKQWREETRNKLRQTGEMWCDYRAKECACDA